MILTLLLIGADYQDFFPSKCQQCQHFCSDPQAHPKHKDIILEQCYEQVSHNVVTKLATT